jgi:hypothetical protein
MHSGSIVDHDHDHDDDDDLRSALLGLQTSDLGVGSVL